ncbi:MAG: translation elongation factor Ts [Candidatus Dadabacteria bacterium]|nr:MAG: translation elongation factor Ts [Candidatus Dadabacteria bacterium]
MANISAQLVKELRDKTGAGMMDCKKALQECDGSIDAAIEYLRKKGLKDLSKRAGKVTAEGTVGIYVHHGSQIAAMVELNCETDFVARGEDFQSLAKDLAMQVAAMNPKYLSEEDVPESVIEKEKEILLEQLDEKKKAMADKIIPGRLKKFFDENCLMNQIFVKDEAGKVTVRDVVNELSVKTGEKVVVRRFVRFEVGEGIEKSEDNLAQEVAALVG